MKCDCCPACTCITRSASILGSCRRISAPSAGLGSFLAPITASSALNLLVFDSAFFPPNHSFQPPSLRNPLVPNAAAVSPLMRSRRRSASQNPFAYGASSSTAAQPRSRSPQEPSRVFESISRSFSNARQAVTGFFTRVTAPRPQQLLPASPALTPAPASSVAPALSPILERLPSSSISTSSPSMVSPPVAGAVPVPAPLTSRRSNSCLPFGSFSSRAAADEGSVTNSLLAHDSDANPARSIDELANDHAAARGSRSSLWRSFSSLWRGSGARYANHRNRIFVCLASLFAGLTHSWSRGGGSYQDLSGGPPT